MFQNQENDENQNEDFIEVKEDNESEYNEDINENKTKIEKYVINIPSNAKKEDLIKLKNFMLNLET
jgi:vacuolar-type H+-ATPase subunit F/Vma7